MGAPVEPTCQTYSNDMAIRLDLPQERYPHFKAADMLQRQKALARLYEELGTLALFDRVHDYATDPSPADNRAYASRQIRRSQIMAEISKLSPSKTEYSNQARIGGAFLLLCAVGYATLRYLLK